MLRLLCNGYCAGYVDGAYRIPEESMDIPKILVHPVGFNDAVKILVQLAGPEVPASWRGGLNITYRLGPNLRESGWYTGSFFFLS